LRSFYQSLSNAFSLDFDTVRPQLDQFGSYVLGAYHTKEVSPRLYAKLIALGYEVPSRLFGAYLSGNGVTSS
jgi:hypothetical protein